MVLSHRIKLTRKTLTKMTDDPPMRKKKPFILPVNDPACFITSEFLNEIEDEIQQTEREQALEFINKYSKNAIREVSDE